MSRHSDRLDFRPAAPEDVPAIVALTRLSLGEQSTEKSEAFWRWKHEQNPAGPSPVLLAWAGDRLVGVRAFMRWTWTDGRRDYRALRAVDTATHPDYRGRGIFKQLTLRLIEECKREGDDFIFNTPNEQSRPGYLKMGWRQVGKLPVRVAPLRPLQLVKTKLLNRPLSPPRNEAPHLPDLLETGPQLGWLEELGSVGPWRTPPTPEFLRWRYLDCPARDYRVVGKADDCLVFYYLRPQAFGNEVRLVHVLCRPGAEKRLRYTVTALARKLRPTVMTAAPGAKLPAYFLPGLPVGLILTYRELNHPAPPPLKEWGYALGDMELF